MMFVDEKEEQAYYALIVEVMKMIGFNFKTQITI